MAMKKSLREAMKGIRSGKMWILAATQGVSRETQAEPEVWQGQGKRKKPMKKS